MKSNNKNNRSNQSILFSILLQLCSKRSTGTVFILTDRDATAQIVLQDSSVIAFSFDDKHGMDAIEDFKNASFTRSQYIENYHFPLTSESNISCSNTFLNQLGFTDFLIDRRSKARKQSRLKCIKPKLLNIDKVEYAA